MATGLGGDAGLLMGGDEFVLALRRERGMGSAQAHASEEAVCWATHHVPPPDRLDLLPELAECDALGRLKPEDGFEDVVACARDGEDRPEKVAVCDEGSEGLVGD